MISKIFERRVLCLLCGAAWAVVSPTLGHAQTAFPASLPPSQFPQKPIGASDPETMLSNNLKILAQNPYDVDALLNAGLGSLAVGDPNAAIGFLARAEELSPRNGRVKAALGAALTQVERPLEALNLFSEAATLGIPDYVLAQDRGLAWDLRGDPRRAQADYVTALKYARSDEVVRRYALSLGISGNKDEALKLLDPLVKRGDQAAWRDRAFIFAMNGDLPEADRIVRAVMPPEMVPVMSPFLRRLPALSFGQRAQAVNFGSMPATGTTVAVVDPGDFRSVGNGTSAGLSSPPPRVVQAAPTSITPVRESASDRRKREKQEKQLAKLAKQGRTASGVQEAVAAPTRLPPVAASGALPKPGTRPTFDAIPPVKVASQAASAQPFPPLVGPAPAPPKPIVDNSKFEPIPPRTGDPRLGHRVGDVDPARIPAPDTPVTIVKGAADLPPPDAVTARVPNIAPAPTSTPPVKIAVQSPPTTPGFTPVQPVVSTPALIPAPTPVPAQVTPQIPAQVPAQQPSPSPVVSKPAEILPAAAPKPTNVVSAASAVTPNSAASPTVSPTVSVAEKPVVIEKPAIAITEPKPAPIAASPTTNAPSAAIGASTPPIGKLPTDSNPGNVTITTPAGSAVAQTLHTPTLPAPTLPASSLPGSTPPAQTLPTQSQASLPALQVPAPTPNLAPDFKPLVNQSTVTAQSTNIPAAPTEVAVITPSTVPPVTITTPSSDQPVAAAPEAGLGSVIEGLEVEEQSSAGPIPTEAEFRARQLAAKRKEEAAAKLAADQKLKAKLAADEKAKELADAKEKEAADQRLAEKKEKEEAAKLKAAPARIWVQVATGANRSGLPITWRKLKADAPKALDGQSAWFVPFRATNRLLVGPFKSSSDARALVSRLSKDGVSANTYTSEAGQEIIRLGGR